MFHCLGYTVHACVRACRVLHSSYALITFATSWRPLSGQVATGLLGGVHTLTVGGMREVKCKYEWSGHTGCCCQSWVCFVIIAAALQTLHIHTYTHTPPSLSSTYQCLFSKRKLLFTCIFFRFFAQLLSYLCVRVVSVELCTQKPHIHKYTHTCTSRRQQHKYIGSRAVSPTSSPRRLPFLVEHKQRAAGDDSDADCDDDDSNCVCVRAE